ncbi:MAG: hypothetical protein AAB618_03820, partial [Patescibacteria group bacterium]
PPPPLDPTEENIIALLHEPRHRDELIRHLNMNTTEASQLLMMMELQGLISSHDNIYRSQF